MEEGIVGINSDGRKKNTRRGEARVKAQEGGVGEGVRERVTPGAELSYLLNRLPSPG